MDNIPPNQVLGVVANSNVIREIEAVLPIDYLPVYVPPILCAERGPADEAFKHDCAERPLCSSQLDLLIIEAEKESFAYPVTVKGIPIARQDLRCYVCDKSVSRRRCWAKI